MYTRRRPAIKPVIFFLIAASLFVAACGGGLTNTSWPGMSASGDVVYVAFGPAVAAVDITEGEQRWIYPSAGQRTVQFYAAPSVEDGRVVLGDYGASGGFLSPGVKVSIYSFEEGEDGTISGAVNVKSELAQDHIVAPPLQVGDRVFVGTADNFVFALDSETLNPIWDHPFEAEHSIWGQPVYDDGVLYVPSLDRNVYALDAETGEQLWPSSVGGSVSDHPEDNSDLIFVSSFDKQVLALNKETGEIVWSAEASAAVWGGPTLAGGVVYFVDLAGNLFAVEAETGDPYWQEPVALGGSVVSSPLVKDGLVYVASAGDPNKVEEERTGFLVARNAENGDNVWKSDAPIPPLFTGPLAVGDNIVVAPFGSQPLLLVFDGQTGDQQLECVLVEQEDSARVDCS